MTRFSVIIPIYNAEANILTCLNKIMEQSYTDFELILVNDGSKDNSEQIITSFIREHQDRKITLINQANAGAGAARNTGIEKASGEYIVFIDADDYVDKNFLLDTDRVIKENDADLVFIDIIREYENGKFIRYERMSDYSNLPKSTMLRWQLTGKMPWGGVRKVIRTSIVKENNLRYATTIKVGEESIYSFLALELSRKIAFQTTSFYHYVDCSTSLTSHDNVNNSQIVFDFISSFFNKNQSYRGYDTTINALAATTVSIVINVMVNNNVSGLYHQSKDIMRKYKNYTDGIINKDALDKRVKLCLPWIKLGWPLPIIFASKLQRLYKKIR